MRPYPETVELKPSVTIEDLIDYGDERAKKDIKNVITDFEDEDVIALLVRDKFELARNHRSERIVGRHSLDNLIERAYQQYHSIVPSCAAGCGGSVIDLSEGGIRKVETAGIEGELDQIESLMGVDIKVSVTKDFVDVAFAVLLDLYVAQPTDILEFSPTPIPSVPEGYMEEWKDQTILMMGTKAMDTNTPVMDMHVMKEKAGDYLIEQLMMLSEHVAENHTRLAQDQMVEGNFDSVLSDFLFNLVLYPYAVIHGPVVEMGSRCVWDGDKLKQESVPLIKWHNVHPRDYYFSPDTKEAGTGEFDIITASISRNELMECVGKGGGFIDSAIKLILRESARGTTSTPSNGVSVDGHVDWFFRKEDDRGSYSAFDSEYRCTLVKYFGSFLGKDLRKLNCIQFEDVADEEYYEIEAWVCAGRTIWVGQPANDVSRRRPIFTSSFQRVQDGIGGYGIAAILEDIEREFTLTRRALAANTLVTCGPIGEYELESLADETSAEQAATITPFKLTAVKPRYAGGAGNVIRYYGVANNQQVFSARMNELRQEAHVRTQIPASLYGMIQGSADRTWRGSAARYAQSMKLIQKAGIALEHHVIRPMGEYMYQVNTLNADDYEEYGDLKGDCQVNVRGAVGQIEKEVRKTEALETLQVIGQVAPVLQGSPEYNVSKMLVDVVSKVIGSLGYDLEEYKYSDEEKMQMQEQARMAQMQQQAAEQAGQQQNTPPAGAL